MITHFFNPPRYMRLLELIKGPDTDEAVYEMIAEFGEDVLGKGIVHAKDTPNFIGNRIGVLGMSVTMNTAIKNGLTVEEVDKLTGTVIGRPKSATFRTADVVGLDTMINVSNTSYKNLPDDEEREEFKIPIFLQKLVDDGNLGAKTKAGFYKKTDEGILSVDLKTGEYGPQKKVRFDGFRLAKDRQTSNEKLKAMAYSDDKGGKFFWEILSRTLIYSANRLPEISDDIINIDNAMKWGYGWESGPFESLGWNWCTENRLNGWKKEGRKVPQWVNDMLASGRESFYELKDGNRTYFDVLSSTVKTEEQSKKSINLNLHKTRRKL